MIRFVGPIQLGDSIPEGFYYLIARIDSNDEVPEFNELNNIAISGARDIQITRLPALRIFNPNVSILSEETDGEYNYLDPREGGVISVDVDESRIHYAESPMRLRFGLQNVGLDSIGANESWKVQINLIGAIREELADLQAAPDAIADDYAAAFSVSIGLGDFQVQEFMEGRSLEMPTGRVLDFDVELALPNGARFQDIIDEDLRVDDYVWSIEIDLDADDEIRESQIVTEFTGGIVPPGLPWRIQDPVEGLFDAAPIEILITPFSDLDARNTSVSEGVFGVFRQIVLIDEAAWETFYGVDARGRRKCASGGEFPRICLLS